MDAHDDENPGSSSRHDDEAAELAALDAEIARLSLRRDQLRARLASVSSSELPAPASGSVPADLTGTTISTPAASVAKADWYPDPFGRYPWRYWNGSEWTASVGRDGVTYRDAPVWNASSAPESSSGPAVQPTQATATVPSSSSSSESVARPARTRPDIDIGNLILIVGAALLIGGVAGLTVWLWSVASPVGRFAILGLAAVLQIGVALRMRERLRVAAEAFAATGAATLLFALGSVGWSNRESWNGTVGVVVGTVGLALLFFARFRAWVIAGHLAIVVGAIAVLVAEPWSQTALIVAAVIGLARLFGTRATSALRPDDVDVFPVGLSASSLVALLAAPVLAGFQYDAAPTAFVLILVAVVVSEVVSRTRSLPREHLLAQVAGAVVAVGGVGWSFDLWLSRGRADGLLGLLVTGVVSILLFRVARTGSEREAWLTAVSIGLAPVAARFVSDPASTGELVAFCAIAAVAGLAVTRFVGKASILGKPFSMWFWMGAVLASIVGPSQTAWPCLGLATIALAALASSLKVDWLWYLAAGTATLAVADLFYGESLEVSWWFRPDLVGVAAAVSLFVANRRQSAPWSYSVGSWSVPRYGESVVALLAVPVVGVVSQPALADLGSESLWRVGLVGVLLVGSWVYGVVRRASPNAVQVVSLLAAVVVVVSRVADESAAVRTGAWTVIGCVFVGAALFFRRVGLLMYAAASWMLVVYLYSPPGPLEVMTGLLAAVAGFVAWLGRRFGRRGTIDFIPATALAIVPSAFAAAGAILDGTVDSGQATRIVVVLVVGTGALVVGTYRRFAALVGPAVIALGALAVAQLIVVQRSTSGWVSAMVAGVVLLVVGTRLEYLRSMSRRAGDLVRSLR